VNDDVIVPVDEKTLVRLEEFCPAPRVADPAQRGLFTDGSERDGVVHRRSRIENLGIRSPDITNPLSARKKNVFVVLEPCSMDEISTRS
jgi:hypothetical protein